jgi:NTE family protein
MVVPHFARESLMELSLMDDLISTMIGNATFDDLVVPIGIVSLDVRSGKSIVFTRGSLRTAVLTSVALPGIFPLIPVRNWLLTDGGPTAKVPVRIARMMGARTVLAVDVSYESPPKNSYDTAFSALARVSDVISHRLRYEDLEQADVVIRPDLGEIAWFEFDAWEFLLREGQEATRQQLEEIRQLYRPSFLERLRRKFRPRRVCPAVHTEFAEAPPL